MNRYSNIIKYLLIVFTLINISAYAQLAETEKDTTKKKFTLGLYIGILIPNAYTASMYDGYGFDIHGNKNSFDNSFIHQKINKENGNFYSADNDHIANELGLNPGASEWWFTEADMPKNMHYEPAFNAAFIARYSVDENNGMLINISMSKLKVSGNFTINTQPHSNATQINESIKTYFIGGEELRLMFQFGLQHYFDIDYEMFKPFLEGGLNATLAKFDENYIIIENLYLDLTGYYNEPNYPASLLVKKPTGMGFGGFIGTGINFATKSQYSAQFSYQISFEKINIGTAPQIKPQHIIGLRFYYNI